MEHEADSLKPEPETRDSLGRWQPGRTPNPYGRAGNPEKRTMVTELRRKADKNASQLAAAAIRKGLQGDTRMLGFIRDTAYGLPAQRLVVEQADSPAAALLAALQNARAIAEARTQLPEHASIPTEDG